MVIGILAITLGLHFSPSIYAQRIRSRRVSWGLPRRSLERSPPSSSIWPIVDITGPHPRMEPVMARCRCIKRYVYWWADGVYFNVRLDEERTCVLVLIGATEDGTKELLAVVDGYRESTQSWRELLGQLKRLGLTSAPKLAIGDGSLGFWIALQEEYGPVAQQRCWVHKTANILDKMPKSVQSKAKQLIHEIYLAPTRKAALAAYDQFISSYQIKFPKACECLQKDKEVLFTFYDFPAQHWSHLRTTNPIESTFATVRLRTHRTKGAGSRIATLTMVFKLGMEAQKHWRRLNGPELVAKVIIGVKFVDGEEQIEQAA